MTNPSELSWVALLSAVAASLLLARSCGAGWRLSRPSTLVGAMSLAMVTCGTWSYYATREFFPQFYVPINTALIYAALGITAASLGAALVRPISGRDVHPERWYWDQAALDRLVLA